MHASRAARSLLGVVAGVWVAMGASMLVSTPHGAVWPPEVPSCFMPQEVSWPMLKRADQFDDESFWTPRGT